MNPSSLVSIFVILCHLYEHPSWSLLCWLTCATGPKKEPVIVTDNRLYMGWCILERIKMNAASCSSFIQYFIWYLSSASWSFFLIFWCDHINEIYVIYENRHEIYKLQTVHSCIVASVHPESETRCFSKANRKTFLIVI